jgi:hypothetical protein
MDVSIKRTKLLEILGKNRDEHTKIYLEACTAYKKEMVKYLQNMIKKVNQAEDGEAIKVYIGLPCPEEHTDDFDRVMDMMEVDTRDIIELDEREAAQYISNKWGWVGSFTTNTMSYSGTTTR